MILKRNYTPAPPLKPPIVHSKPKNEAELEGVIYLRKLRVRLVILGLFYLPYGMFVASIIPSEAISFVFVLIYFCAIAYTGFRSAIYICPRCKRNFHWGGSIANGFTSKCMNCGLSLRKKDLSIDSKNAT